MKVIFNGTVEKNVKGCTACGRARYENVPVRYRSYFLPSGIEKTFYKGKPVELSDDDANFLLSMHYRTPSGEIKDVFSRG